MSARCLGDQQTKHAQIGIDFLALNPHLTMTETLPVNQLLEEGGLEGSEIFWRENYQLLHDRGYQLRPRYSPDWVPSWMGTNKYFRNFEDGIYLAVSPSHIPQE